MDVPFLDLQAAYLELRSDIDQACRRVLGSGWYRIHWPSFYNVVTGKTLALPNLIALQHIPLSPAGVIAKRPAPIALPNSCAA